MGSIWGGSEALPFWTTSLHSWAVLKRNYRPGFKRVTWVRLRLVVDPEANRNDLGAPPLFHHPVRCWQVVHLHPLPALAEHRALAARTAHCAPWSLQGASQPCQHLLWGWGGCHLFRPSLLLERRPLIRAAQPAPRSISGAKELGR